MDCPGPQLFNHSEGPVLGATADSSRTYSKKGKKKKKKEKKNPARLQAAAKLHLGEWERRAENVSVKLTVG